MSQSDLVSHSQRLLYVLARETPEVAGFRFSLMYNHGLLMASMDQNLVEFELYSPLAKTKQFMGRLTPRTIATTSEDLRRQGSWIFRLDENGEIYPLPIRDLIGATRFILDREPPRLKHFARTLSPEEQVSVANHLYRAGRPVAAT